MGGGDSVARAIYERVYDENDERRILRRKNVALLNCFLYIYMYEYEIVNKILFFIISAEA